MGAIGGIMEIKDKGIDVCELDRMRRSMALRGRVRGTAFFKGQMGMLFGSSDADAFEPTAEKQPFVCERQGGCLALCIDSDRTNTAAVMEKYLISGMEFVGALDGDFALALYDERRGVLILATDKDGSRPLYYSISDGRVLFASEPKALLDSVDGYVRVDKEVLAMHLLSPVGIYGAQDIYPEIHRVSGGECVIFTAFGHSRFFYRVQKADKGQNGARTLAEAEVLSPYVCTKPEFIYESLDNALLAFDYPQFDCYLPGIMRLFEQTARSGGKNIFFADAVRRQSLPYAREREDRLSALYGIRGKGVMIRNAENEALSDMEKALAERLENMSAGEAELLRTIIGERTLYSVLNNKKSEDTERCIRILGMLCQTLQWAALRPLDISPIRSCHGFQL